MGLTQAPGASMSRRVCTSTYVRACRVVSACSRFLRYDMRPFDFLQVLMAFSPLEGRVLWIGYLVGQLLRGPQTLQCSTLCRVWNTGYLFRVSLWGALVWGRTCFQSSGCWSQALRDPCLHRVVDNSLLLMVLSVPPSSQSFLEVVGARSRGTHPAFNAGSPVPFPSCRFLAVDGETMSFLPHL